MPIPQRLGSLTKEPPLARLDATLQLISPGITYSELLGRARSSVDAHPDAPGLLRSRFITVDSLGKIVYDGLLALIKSHGVGHPRVRKVMYFLWMMRDQRVRRFILERVADTSGRWQPSKLLDKDNAEFFEAFSRPGPARKIRSNIEFFLTEAGIFNPHDGSVHLGLEDGWLTDAMIILAGEETSAAARDAMLHDPVSFLFSEGLNGLVNLSEPALSRNYAGELNPEVLVDDVELPTGPILSDKAQVWTPRTVTPFQAGVPGVALNIVARERASKAHQQLERIVARAITAQGLQPRFTPLIDILYDVDESSVIVEVKSAHLGNVHSQIRRAVAQLLEYRFLHKHLLKQQIILVLILEVPPPNTKSWLIPHLLELGISIAWKHPSTDVVVSSIDPPSQLSGIVENVE